MKPLDPKKIVAVVTAVSLAFLQVAPASFAAIGPADQLQGTSVSTSEKPAQKAEVTTEPQPLSNPAMNTTVEFLSQDGGISLSAMSSNNVASEDMDSHNANPEDVSSSNVAEDMSSNNTVEEDISANNPVMEDMSTNDPSANEIYQPSEADAAALAEYLSGLGVMGDGGFYVDAGNVTDLPDGTKLIRVTGNSMIMPSEDMSLNGVQPSQAVLPSDLAQLEFRVKAGGGLIKDSLVATYANGIVIRGSIIFDAIQQIRSDFVVESSVFYLMTQIPVSVAAIDSMTGLTSSVDFKFPLDNKNYHAVRNPDGTVTPTEILSSPPEVEAHVSELRAMLGDAYQVYAVTDDAYPGKYIVKIELKDASDVSNGQFVMMKYMIDSKGNFIAGYVNAYYQDYPWSETLRYEVLFDAVRQLPGVFDTKTIVGEMAKLVISKVEGGAIYFALGETDYKCYRDAEGNVILEDLTKLEQLRKTILERVAADLAASNAAIERLLAGYDVRKAEIEAQVADFLKTFGEGKVILGDLQSFLREALGASLPIELVIAIRQYLSKADEFLAGPGSDAGVESFVNFLRFPLGQIRQVIEMERQYVEVLTQYESLVLKETTLEALKELEQNYPPKEMVPPIGFPPLADPRVVLNQLIEEGQSLKEKIPTIPPAVQAFQVRLEGAIDQSLYRVEAPVLQASGAYRFEVKDKITNAVVRMVDVTFDTQGLMTRQEDVMNGYKQDGYCETTGSVITLYYPGTEKKVSERIHWTIVIPGGGTIPDITIAAVNALYEYNLDGSRAREASYDDSDRPVTENVYTNGQLIQNSTFEYDSQGGLLQTDTKTFGADGFPKSWVTVFNHQFWYEDFDPVTGQRSAVYYRTGTLTRGYYAGTSTVRTGLNQYTYDGTVYWSGGLEFPVVGAAHSLDEYDVQGKWLRNVRSEQILLPLDVYQSVIQNLPAETRQQVDAAMLDVGTDTQYSFETGADGSNSWSWTSAKDARISYSLTQQGALWSFMTVQPLSLQAIMDSKNPSLAPEAREALDRALDDMVGPTAYAFQRDEANDVSTWSWDSASVVGKSYALTKQGDVWTFTEVMRPVQSALDYLQLLGIHAPEYVSSDPASRDLYGTTVAGYEMKFMYGEAQHTFFVDLSGEWIFDDSDGQWKPQVARTVARLLDLTSVSRAEYDSMVVYDGGFVRLPSTYESFLACSPNAEISNDLKETLSQAFALDPQRFVERLAFVRHVIWRDYGSGHGDGTAYPSAGAIIMNSNFLAQLNPPVEYRPMVLMGLFFHEATHIADLEGKSSPSHVDFMKSEVNAYAEIAHWELLMGQIMNYNIKQFYADRIPDQNYNGIVAQMVSGNESLGEQATAPLLSAIGYLNQAMGLENPKYISSTPAEQLLEGVMVSGYDFVFEAQGQQYSFFVDLTGEWIFDGAKWISLTVEASLSRFLDRSTMTEQEFNNTKNAFPYITESFGSMTYAEFVAHQPSAAEHDFLVALMTYGMAKDPARFRELLSTLSHVVLLTSNSSPHSGSGYGVPGTATVVFDLGGSVPAINASNRDFYVGFLAHEMAHVYSGASGTAGEIYARTESVRWMKLLGSATAAQIAQEQFMIDHANDVGPDGDAIRSYYFANGASFETAPEPIAAVQSFLASRDLADLTYLSSVVATQMKEDVVVSGYLFAFKKSDGTSVSIFAASRGSDPTVGWVYFGGAWYSLADRTALIAEITSGFANWRAELRSLWLSAMQGITITGASATEARLVINGNVIALPTDPDLLLKYNTILKIIGFHSQILAGGQPSDFVPLSPEEAVMAQSLGIDPTSNNFGIRQMTSAALWTSWSLTEIQALVNQMSGETRILINENFQKIRTAALSQDTISELDRMVARLLDRISVSRELYAIIGNAMRAMDPAGYFSTTPYETFVAQGIPARMKNALVSLLALAMATDNAQFLPLLSATDHIILMPLEANPIWPLVRDNWIFSATSVAFQNGAGGEGVIIFYCDMDALTGSGSEEEARLALPVLVHDMAHFKYGITDRARSEEKQYQESTDWMRLLHFPTEDINRRQWLTHRISDANYQVLAAKFVTGDIGGMINPATGQPYTYPEAEAEIMRPLDAATAFLQSQLNPPAGTIVYVSSQIPVPLPMRYGTYVQGYNLSFLVNGTPQTTFVDMPGEWIFYNGQWMPQFESLAARLLDRTSISENDYSGMRAYDQASRGGFSPLPSSYAVFVAQAQDPQVVAGLLATLNQAWALGPQRFAAGIQGVQHILFLAYDYQQAGTGQGYPLNGGMVVNSSYYASLPAQQQAMFLSGLIFHEAIHLRDLRTNPSPSLRDLRVSEGNAYAETGYWDLLFGNTVMFAIDQFLADHISDNDYNGLAASAVTDNASLFFQVINPVLTAATYLEDSRGVPSPVYRSSPLAQRNHNGTLLQGYEFGFQSQGQQYSVFVDMSGEWLFFGGEWVRIGG